MSTEIELNYEEIASLLQQRIATITANYEGDIAILQSQVRELSRALQNLQAQNSDEKGDPEADEVV